jgi:hypothetical protein
MNFQLGIWHAFTDVEDMDFLIEIWREANGIEQVTDSMPVIPSVDAVAFRPRITIDDIPRDRCLSEIAGILPAGISPLKP